MKVPVEQAPKHCDEYIQDFGAPKLLRWFLFVNRLPAPDRILCREFGVEDPVLFADYNGKRVRVVMASSLGDVGITENLETDRYTARVAVEDLTNFSLTP